MKQKPPQPSISSAYTFQPRQIVCLEYKNTRLYAEVIEVVASRQVCWVRPLVLAVSATEDDLDSLLLTSLDSLTVYDLRQGSDLVWPVRSFRPALDTEVIPLVMQLNDQETQTADTQEAHQQLSRFVREVWQAHRRVV